MTWGGRGRGRRAYALRRKQLPPRQRHGQMRSHMEFDWKVALWLGGINYSFDKRKHIPLVCVPRLNPESGS